MKFSVLKAGWLKLGQTVAIALFCCVTLLAAGMPTRAALTPEAEAYEIQSVEPTDLPGMVGDRNESEAFDLDQAAEKAEEASSTIFDGLETTKRIKGKTPMRNEIIEEAREHASEKLEDIADRARSANSPQELSPKENLILKRYQGVEE